MMKYVIMVLVVACIWALTWKLEEPCGCDCIELIEAGQKLNETQLESLDGIVGFMAAQTEINRVLIKMAHREDDGGGGRSWVGPLQGGYVKYLDEDGNVCVDALVDDVGREVGDETPKSCPD